MAETTSGPAAESALIEGRRAAARGDWATAASHLTEADAAGQLGAADLDTLAEALYVTGRSDGAIAARSRAHNEFRAAGDPAGAAAMALKMCGTFWRRQQLSVFGGWVAAATRLLADQPESAAHGLLAWVQANGAMFAERDAEAGLALGERASAIGRRHGDFDVETLGRVAQAEAHQMAGRVPTGMSLIDEVMSCAIAGALSPWVANHTLCRTMVVCQAVGDLARAAQWSEAALTRFSDVAIVPVLGDCRVHRAGLLRALGRWKDAEEEARRGCEQIPDDRLHLAMASCDVGEIRLREGDLAAAEEAFERAHGLGGAPHPGLGLVQLARGELGSAAALIEQALDEEASAAGRAGLLAARIEVATEAGDLPRAGAALAELEDIAALIGTPALAAMTATGRGAVSLVEDDAAAAARSLRDGRRLWEDVGAPYDTARARARLAAAHRARGDRDSAALELRSALTTFERLGALPDARRTEGALRELALEAEAEHPPDRRRRTFMFTDIVGSTNLVEAIGDDAWTDIQRWHDRTLRDLFAAHRGEEANHAGDGFFVTFDRPAEALACATAIQRTLAAHRRTHGFAPRVRIGIHADEAARTSASYSGRGVHLAARVGAEAGADEVVVSRSTLDGIADAEILSSRLVSLKGFAEPVEVATVAWR